jgi:hypothetical protein
MLSLNGENARYVLAGVIAVVWVLIQCAPLLKAGFKKAVKAVKAAAGVWPKVSQKTNVFSAWPLIGILAVLCLPMSESKCPVPEPVKPPDIFDTCSDANRVLIADLIRKFAGEKYETVQAAEDAMNQGILDAYQASYDPLFKQINEARKAGKLVEFASRLESGDVR